MKKLCLFFVPGLLFAACKKEKEVDTRPKVLTYHVFDSIYMYNSYYIDRDGVYRQDNYDTSFAADYMETITIDTFADVKTLTFRGVSFPREKNSSNRFSKSGPAPLKGNFISITLRNDSLFINCEIDRRQTWQKYYALKGRLK